MHYLRKVEISRPSIEQQSKFPYNVGIFKYGLDFEFKKPVTIFAGENACGKSTLLEGIAVVAGFPRQGGARGQNLLRKSFSMNNFGEMVESNFDNLDLTRDMRLVWSQKTKGYFFRSEYMSETLSLHLNAREFMSCSHGEGILQLVKGFRDGLFILDEPESALSPTSLLALAALIYENTKNYKAQYIIVTHSPFLMAIPNGDFCWISHEKIESIKYENSPHFQIQKMFFNNPEYLIKRTLE